MTQRLSVNHGGYLEQHLRRVIEMIETPQPRATGRNRDRP